MPLVPSPDKLVAAAIGLHIHHPRRHSAVLALLEETVKRRPQDWIVQALDGFFANEGREMPAGMKGDLVARMTLACTGIQGEAEIEPFTRLLNDGVQKS